MVGGLTTSQFWLMASAVFDSVQARRLFPVLAVGGIAYALVQLKINHFAGGDTFFGYRLGLELVTAAAPLYVLGWLAIKRRRSSGSSSSSSNPAHSSWSRSAHRSRTLVRSK